MSKNANLKGFRLKIVPIIMSGGSGTRLWPISTRQKPKQFHALATKNTMIQETILRLKGDEFLEPIIICGNAHLENVQSQMAQVGTNPSKIILEPMPRNTAAVAALASICAEQLGPDVLALLLPADHIVSKPKEFQAAVLSAVEAAKTRIITFGINPTKPETGYGYIKKGTELGENIYSIQEFCEKPNLETANEYVNGGNHFWNGGIFLFSPEIMKSEMLKNAPDVYKYSRLALDNAKLENAIYNLCESDFAQIPSISIDYAIMEKTNASAVVPCDIGWADVGSFSEIWRLGEKDENGNHSPSNAIHIDSKDNLILSEQTRVAIIGLEDIMVIVADGGILVAPKSRAQDVKIACEMAKKTK
jgi:mannose-1-phosphate guanylyltransferase/mannose-6-phosphate isomerase